MATAKKTSANDWMDNQKQYWDSWFSTQKSFFEKQFGNNNSFMSGNWADFFNEWQSSMQGQKTAGSPSPDAYRQAFEAAGQNFLKMMEQFYQSAGLNKQPEDALTDWTAAMQKYYETIIAANSQPFDMSASYKAFNDAVSNFGPTWWSQQFNAPDTDGNHPHHTSSFLFDPFGFYASVPGIGYSREKQDHANKLYTLWVEYDREMRRYNTEMTKVGLEALKAFQQYIQNPPEGAAPLQSLKDIYIKWVDINEEIYAEYAMSDEYTQMYGDVVNALTAFKKQQHIITDDIVEQFNLPTRAELDSLNQKTQVLKRENAQLRKDVEALKKAAGLAEKKPVAAKPQPQAKKPAPKKPTAKKGKKK